MAFNPISDWSAVPAENVQSLTGILMDEGMPPAALNDGVRTVMAAIFNAYIDRDALSNLTPTQIAAWIIALGVAKVDGSNINVTLWQNILGITGGGGSGAQTGDIKTTLVGAAVPAGYVKMDGSTIGDAASGATGYAAADAVNLFTLLWGLDPTATQLQSSTGVNIGRGASAAADFAANCRITVPDARGRFLRGLDGGLGLDPGRLMGTLQAAQLQSHTHNHGVGTQNAGHANIYGTTATGVPGAASDFLTSSGGAPTEQGVTSTTGGGADNRPVNLAVHYFIAL